MSVRAGEHEPTHFFVFDVGSSEAYTDNTGMVPIFTLRAQTNLLLERLGLEGRTVTAIGMTEYGFEKEFMPKVGGRCYVVPASTASS